MPCSNGKTELTEEKRELRCQGLFDEFLQNIDLDEAVLSAQELATPGTYHPSLHLTFYALLMILQLACPSACPGDLPRVVDMCSVIPMS